VPPRCGAVGDLTLATRDSGWQAEQPFEHRSSPTWRIRIGAGAGLEASRSDASAGHIAAEAATCFPVTAGNRCHVFSFPAVSFGFSAPARVAGILIGSAHAPASTDRLHPEEPQR
jgi:hypothetical protein